jgi:hypothetical protein
MLIRGHWALVWTGSFTLDLLTDGGRAVQLSTSRGLDAKPCCEQFHLTGYSYRTRESPTDAPPFQRILVAASFGAEPLRRLDFDCRRIWYRKSGSYWTNNQWQCR